MRKRKINPQYLRQITSQQISETRIDALDFADSIKRFSEEYLAGIMQAYISGISRGYVKLNLPVASYLIRLLCEAATEDEVVALEIRLDEELTMTARYVKLAPAQEIAELIKVARLAGFEVSRFENSLTFKAQVYITSIMQIYATSGEEFLKMLVLTYDM